MLKDDIKDQINKLIQINIDASKGYLDAGSAVSDADLQKVFNASSLERKGYADELTAQVNRHGGEPEDDSSIAATLHRTWMTFKADLTTHNEGTIVDECIRGEEEAHEAYHEAMHGKAYPPAIEAMVIKQHASVKTSLDQLKEWKNLLDKKVIADK